jgi:hypothetical protein
MVFARLYRRGRFCACSGIVSFPRMACRNTNQERRTMKNGELRFDGQIKWCKGENTIQWSAPEKTTTTGRPDMSTQKAVFGSGDSTTNKACRNEILSFGSQKQRVEQFLIVEPIIFRLWQALIDAFGYPTLKNGSGGGEA